MIHEHWTKHLDEAGTIANWGAEQEIRQGKAAKLRDDAKKIDEEYKAEEVKIEREARRHWTDEEISDAKANALTYATRQDRRDAERASLYK